jgi:hypothetical protein
MSITNKGAGAKAAEQAIESYRRQRDDMVAERDEIGNALRSLRTELVTVKEELASLLFPNASVDHLANLDACLVGLGLAAKRSRKEGERPVFAARLARVEASPDYAQREALLSDYNGELGHGLFSLRAQCEELSERRDAMDACSTFTFALNRHLERAEGLSTFQSFWRAVTFSSTRENSARKNSCEKFGYTDWDTMLADYDSLYETLAVQVPKLSETEERRRRLDELVLEQQQMHGWVHDFESKLAEHLRQVFIDHSDDLGLDKICGRLKGKAAYLVAKLDAIRAKVAYLQSLDCYLEAEAMDRSARVSKLSRVKSRWAAKSWDRLRSDKTKWLVTVPAIKAESSEKCCRWSRRVRQNLEDYQDYESYGAYLAGVPGMLAYDAFAYGSTESMPYEGFTRAAIPALDRYRRDKNQAKPDYAPFKKIDKERGAKTRDPREEAGDYESYGNDGHDGTDSMWDDGDLAVAAVAVGGAAYYSSSHSSDFTDLS